MKEKLKKKLQDAVKDYGLSEKAIEALYNSASKGLKDDASDADIDALVSTFAEIGKEMQAESTRKVQDAKKSFKKDQQDDDDHSDDDHSDDDKEDPNEPDWFKKYRKSVEKQISDLKKENETITNEKKIADRKSEIAALAKELGIPDYLMKNYSIADDADARKQLTEFKQDLVNNKLLPKDAGGDKITEQAALEAEAEDWVKNLPEK
jgi:hypothetical protein